MLKDSEYVAAALAVEIPSTTPSNSTLSVPTAGTPLAKVQARLLSNKIIASEVSSAIAALKAIINPELAPPPAKKAKANSEPLPSAEKGEKKKGTAKENLKKLVDHAQEDASSDDDERSDADGESNASERVQAFSDEEDVDGAGWESGSVSGDEGAGWESGSIDGSEPGEDDSDVQSGPSDDDSDDDDRIVVPKKGVKKDDSKAKAKAVTASNAKSKAESTFLPSLSVGFIPGSDDSDIDEDAVPERKNRRGQRARRA